VTQLAGEFDRGETVRVLDEEGHELARGITSYSSADLERLRGHHSDEIEALLGYDYGDEVIHRNDLVFL
jgi:glutamate 5-kinase